MNDHQAPVTPLGPSTPGQPSAPQVPATPAESSATPKTPKKKKARHWYQSPSIIIATLALLVSVISSLAAILNNNSTAKNQDEQQLLTLVQDLTQIPAQQAALQQTYSKNPATLQNLNGDIAATEVVESEEAAQLIRVLGYKVPGIEAYEVAYAFGLQGNYGEAIQFYSLAASRTTDPFLLTAVYRGWAQSLYNLGEPKPARVKIAAAYSAYAHTTNVALYAKTDSYIYTTLFQVPFEIGVHNCSYAKKQLLYAVRLIASLPSTEGNYAAYVSEAARVRQQVTGCS